MRESLARIEGQRHTFRATFARFGVKNGWKGRQEKTLLLRDVVDALGNPVTDHLWCNFTKQFEALDLQPGDLVEFQARSAPYLKGYRGYREDVEDRPITRDYRLSNPTHVRKLAQAEPVSLPLFEPVLNN